MLDYLRFRWKLRKLEKEDRKLDREYEKKIAAAKATETSEDQIGGLELEAAHVSFYSQEQIRKLHSEYLIKRASRLIVPIPEYGTANGMWERDQQQYAYLSEHGINKLRTDLRAEKRARLDLFLMWVPGVVGILGALIGLASILMKK